jgi:hypothetical protein
MGDKSSLLSLHKSKISTIYVEKPFAVIPFNASRARMLDKDASAIRLPWRIII